MRIQRITERFSPDTLQLLRFTRFLTKPTREKIPHLQQLCGYYKGDLSICRDGVKALGWQIHWHIEHSSPRSLLSVYKFLSQAYRVQYAISAYCYFLSHLLQQWQFFFSSEVYKEQNRDNNYARQEGWPDDSSWLDAKDIKRQSEKTKGDKSRLVEKQLLSCGRDEAAQKKQDVDIRGLPYENQEGLPKTQYLRGRD